MAPIWENKMHIGEREKEEKLTVLQVGTLNKPIRTDQGYCPVESVIYNVDKGLVAAGHRSIVACSADSQTMGEKLITVERSFGDYCREGGLGGQDVLARHLAQTLSRTMMGDIDIVHLHEWVAHVYDGRFQPFLPIVVRLPPRGVSAGHYWIAAGTEYEEVQRLNERVQEITPSGIIKRTSEYWGAWVKKESRSFGDLPSTVTDLFDRSLLVLRTQIDNQGAIIAANDSDIVRFGRDTYSYMWGRDGAFVAAAMAKLGYSEVCRRFFKFCSSVLTDEGYLFQHYNPDGSQASNWHPWLHDGEVVLPIQEDSTALVIWALWIHFQCAKDIEFIRPLYRPLIIVLSISEMLEIRFDKYARLISAVIMATYAAMIAVIQVIAIGTILSAMAGWAMATGMLAGGLVILFYTFLGGMWSISLTDFIQFALMTVGIFFLMLPAGLLSTGGWHGLWNGLPPSYARFDTIGYDEIFAFFLLFFLGLLIGQDIWQRVFTAKEAKVARRGTLVAGAYCILYAAATALIGMVAALKLPHLEDPQMAFATLAVELLPVGVRGIVLAGSLSALMSTASGPLLASSTLMANDVYRCFAARELTDQEFLRTTRFITGGLGLGVIACALWIQDVIHALDVAYTLLSGSIFVPVFAGFFWKRANAAGTLASMCLSAAAAVGAMAYWGIGSTPPIMIGLTTSLVALVSVSLLTAPPRAEQLSRWEKRLAGLPASKVPTLRNA